MHQSYRPPKAAVRRKTQQNTSLTFSVSSEDPDGLLVAHDAQPDTVPNNFNGLRRVMSHERTNNRRWTQSTMGGASSYYPPSVHSNSDQLTTDDSSSLPGTPTTVSNYAQLDALVEEEGGRLPLAPITQDVDEDDGSDDAPYLYHPHHRHIVDPNDVSYRLKLLVENNYYLPPRTQ